VTLRKPLAVGVFQNQPVEDVNRIALSVGLVRTLLLSLSFTVLFSVFCFLFSQIFPFYFDGVFSLSFEIPVLFDSLIFLLCSCVLAFHCFFPRFRSLVHFSSSLLFFLLSLLYFFTAIHFSDSLRLSSLLYISL
jgi:hypothetical protein